jgi:hypothetical protein
MKKDRDEDRVEGLDEIQQAVEHMEQDRQNRVEDALRAESERKAQEERRRDYVSLPTLNPEEAPFAPAGRGGDSEEGGGTSGEDTDTDTDTAEPENEEDARRIEKSEQHD